MIKNISSLIKLSTERKISEKSILKKFVQDYLIIVGYILFLILKDNYPNMIINDLFIW